MGYTVVCTLLHGQVATRRMPADPPGEEAWRSSQVALAVCQCLLMHDCGTFATSHSVGPHRRSPRDCGRRCISVAAGAGTTQKHHDTNEALASHQDELEERMREEALRRLANGGAAEAGPSMTQQTPIAYKDANQYPTSSATGGPLRTNQTFVDGKSEAVLLPISGRLVPFHISMIKNVSKSEEGAWTFLRINFVTPGGGVGSQVCPPHSHPSSLRGRCKRVGRGGLLVTERLSK